MEKRREEASITEWAHCPRGLREEIQESGTKGERMFN
jgi:hypothetical protein